MGAIDWGQSGRIDSFEFERIATTNLNKVLGKLEGVVGGSLSFSYDSSNKLTGSLRVADCNFVRGCLIRIYMVSTLGKDTEKIELATCYPVTADLEYENGKCSGTIDLLSPLARFTEDKLYKNYSIKAGSSAITVFKNIFSWLGGKYSITGVSDKNFTKNHVIKFGESPMGILQKCADAVGGEITCDTHGRTVLRKYVSMWNKSVVYTFPTGERSIILPGLKIVDGTATKPNRVACMHKYQDSNKKDAYIYSRYAVSDDYSTSYSSCGRWITETYEITNLTDKTKTALDEICKKKLTNCTNGAVKYQFTSYFAPIHIGEVVKFTYDDVTITGLVTNIELDLSVGGKMKVTVKQRKRNGKYFDGLGY
jgi:hypothetical protein